MNGESTMDNGAAGRKAKIDPNEFPSIGHYAFISRDRTLQDFRASNAKVIADTLGQMNGPYALKLACIAYDANFGSSPRFDAFAVLFKSIDILISALHMTCQRQRTEAFALLRLALETAATGLHICKNHNAFVRYAQMKYKSTAAISFAKGVVPCLGEVWGGLSQTAVHANASAFGPQYFESDDGEGTVGCIDLSFDVRQTRPGQDEMALIFISLGANIILRLAEEALLDKSGDCPGWLHIPGTRHLYFCGTDRRIKKYHEKIAALPLQYQGSGKTAKTKVSNQRSNRNVVAPRGRGSTSG